MLLLDHASFVKKKKKTLRIVKTYVLLTGKTQERTLGKNERQLLNEKAPLPPQGKITTELPGATALSPLRLCGPHSGICQGRESHLRWRINGFPGSDSFFLSDSGTSRDERLTPFQKLQLVERMPAWKSSARHCSRASLILSSDRSLFLKTRKWRQP